MYYEIKKGKRKTTCVLNDVDDVVVFLCSKAVKFDALSK